ncbi:hypothetical protein [Paraburkholderia youngii]|uniref:hypothetical protein n=1 Tax=Paraburkholderia youngii TaxID=2782701 RepID=UPI003D23746F
MRNVLLELACRSALLRIARRTGTRPNASTAFAEAPGQLWFALNDALREDMAKLGRQHRGTGNDARTSPFWILLEHQLAYEQTLAPVVHVEMAELDPSEIYRGLANGHVLHWGKWEIDPGSPQELRTSDGLNAMESRVWVNNPGGVKRSFSGITLTTARDIYLHIAFSQPKRIVGPAVTQATVSPAANSPVTGLAPTGT